MYFKLEQITFFIGRAICHQLPERTLNMSGHYLPLCARDTGIYLGIFSSLMFIFLLKRYKHTKIPNLNVSFTLLFLLLPLIIDGISSYSGLYSTTNFIRITTGLLFGIVLPFFLIPIFSFNPFEKKAIPIIRNIHELLIPLTIAVASVYLILHSFLFFILLHVLIIGTLVYWVSLLFFLYFKRLNSPLLSIGLSFASSILILTSMSYIHSFVRVYY